MVSLKQTASGLYWWPSVVEWLAREGDDQQLPLDLQAGLRSVNTEAVTVLDWALSP